MRLEQLEYLLEVKHTQSMNLAGSRFHISQQAISHAIKELEQELACALLYKTNKGSYLTPEGEIAADYAERAFALLTEMRQKLAADPSRLQKEQRTIAAIFSQSSEQLYLLYLLPYWYQNYADITLNVKITTVDEAVEAIVKHQADIGCITIDKEGLAALPQEVIFVPLQSFYPYIICSIDSPLAAKSSVSVADLTGYRITTKASQDAAENYGYKLLCKHHMLENVILSSVSDSRFIQELVTSNVAIGVFFQIQGLSSASARPLDDGQLYVPIAEKERFQFGYLFNKKQGHSKAQLLIDVLEYLCQLRNDSYFMKGEEHLLLPKDESTESTD